ncbi:MAG: hypothetical protein IKO46_09590 [Salinivirgaceae bacterium]|nr:hypothetical protein [Salinivirgaceae bacterium]MBR3566734.1 hypothetical protein [Salinivirgaceae bacterium]MBR4621224.1 hypothetical protein [Salinivirgaceae bacterium]
METKDIKEKVEHLEHLLFRATLEEYPKLAREYSYWAEKLAEREKVSTKRRTEDGDEDDDDEENDDEANDEIADGDDDEDGE